MSGSGCGCVWWYRIENGCVGVGLGMGFGVGVRLGVGLCVGGIGSGVWEWD